MAWSELDFALDPSDGEFLAAPVVGDPTRSVAGARQWRGLRFKRDQVLASFADIQGSASIVARPHRSSAAGAGSDGAPRKGHGSGRRRGGPPPAKYHNDLVQIFAHADRNGDDILASSAIRQQEWMIEQLTRRRHKRDGLPGSRSGRAKAWKKALEEAQELNDRSDATAASPTRHQP